MKKTTAIPIALLASAVVLNAQAVPQPVTITGSVSTGTAQVGNDTNSSKMSEYRDPEQNAYVPRLFFSAFRPGANWFIDASGANVGRGDAAFLGRAGQAGRWSVSIDWLNVPHNFSKKAQTPYTFAGDGLLRAPGKVPITFKKLATAAADTPGVLASDALIADYQKRFLHPTDLATDTNFGRVAGDFNTDAVRVGLAYDLRRQNGLKSGFGPIGDRPPRTLNLQLTEPVDNMTQDVTLSAERVGKRYQIQFNYLFSNFSNRIDTLVWENIYTTAAPDSPFDVWDRAVSVFGRRPLNPDNAYHNLSLSVARDLPAESRLSATVSVGLMGQDQQLLPYSYSSGSSLPIPALPRPNADASMRTTQALLEYTINPAPRLSVRSWLRHYGLDNNTPEARWQYVTSDTTNLNGSVSYKNKRVNLAYSSDRNNAGADATYRMKPWRSSLAVGYEHEWITRQYRESDTGEHRVTALFRARPSKWSNLRARYQLGSRTGTYDPFVTRQSYWYARTDANDNDNPGFTFSNHPDMRRFDTSDRRRNIGELTLTLAPREVFSVSANVRYRADDFDSKVTASRPLAGTGYEETALTPGAQLGLLKDNRLRYSLDAAYTPAERFSLNAFAGWERGFSRQRNLEYDENRKQDPSTVLTAVLGPWTRGSSQWTADSDDRAWTAGVGASISLIPKRMNLNANYTMSLGDFDLTYAGYGVTSFDGTPFPPNYQFAFPARPPRVNQDLHIFDINLDIPVARKASFVLGYSYEYYRTDDWQQGSSYPWVEPVGSEFLLRDTSQSYQWGNRLFNMGTFLAPGYNGHIVRIAFQYRF